MQPTACSPPASSATLMRDARRDPDAPRFAASRAHQARAHFLIPGGGHTYARGDDQMPEAMPVVVAHGAGCRVTDLDGNAYVEYGMGLRAVTLGYAHPEVTDAAARAMAAGTGFTRPAAIEAEAAEAFLDAVGWADQVKFCKDGSSATTAAVTLARAATGRDVVALCADHPFLSQHDWFIGTTEMAAGIPDAVRGLVRTFPYGDLAALDALLAAEPVAAVVLEPTRAAAPPDGYLAGVVATAHRHGAVVVFDEMITGFRYHGGDGRALWGATPDLASFGKALGNGFAVSALAGRADLMDLGGLATERDRVFLLSSTHGAETHALAAMQAVLAIYRRDDVPQILAARGAAVRAAVEAAARDAGVARHVTVSGHDANLVFSSLDADGRPSQAYRTLLLQELTRRGVLAPSLVVSAAHDAAAVEATADAFAGALAVYARALDAGTTDGFLFGRPVQPALRRRAGLVWSDPPWADAPAGDGLSRAGGAPSAPSLTLSPDR